MADILAIVGSTDWHGADDAFLHARALIVDVLAETRPDEVITGGAVGVDTAAVEIAETLGIPWREVFPENRRWAPRGFKARNIIVARTCSRMLCIRSSVSRTFGSGWTANLAESWGKPVDRHAL